MKYNSGKKYNFTGATGGGLYNSAQFVILIKIFETLSANDKIQEITVKNILEERYGVFDELTQYAFREFSDSLSLKDDFKLTALQSVAEKLNIKDILDDLIVLFYLKENSAAIDEFKQLNAIITKSEKMKLNEIKTLEALVSTADGCGLTEAAKMLAEIKQYEYARVTDRAPRKAISDFMIGYEGGLDTAHEWFLPLNMMYDPERSEIQVMPQTESTYIEMPYMDGSITENTVYKNRFFNIVAWSQDGLSTYQKEQLKSDIARLLDSTKDKAKKLTLQKSDIAFDVKYSGNADIKEGPSFVKVAMPFECNPYGYPLFDQTVYGTGLIVNGGDKDIGVINIISGGCKNPSFQIGNIVYKWEGTVPINSQLFINHEDMTCYLEDTSGKRTQALTELTGDFQVIHVGQTLQITAFGETNHYLKTIVKEKILWKK